MGAGSRVPVVAARPRFIAVDWGTTRLRASLIGTAGEVLARTQSDSGVQSVTAGGFHDALNAACGSWLDDHPGLPVIMAGMVGSRNGWVEAPYMPCPCGPVDAAARLTRIVGIEHEMFIVPGADVRWDGGAYDVMRGEETQVFGAGVENGLVCLPGTHSKWVKMAAGRMTAFATFITGELYAALSGSFVGRLAETPEDSTGAAGKAAGALSAGGGLLRAAFQARSQVLAGDMRPSAVRPFLSALVIEAEIDGARGLFGEARTVRLVAAEPQLNLYRSALEARGMDVTVIDPETATLAGLDRIMAARTEQ